MCVNLYWFVLSVMEMAMGNYFHNRWAGNWYFVSSTECVTASSSCLWLKQNRLLMATDKQTARTLESQNSSAVEKEIMFQFK